MTKNSLFIKRLTIGLLRLTIICALMVFASTCSNNTTTIMSSYDEKFPVKNDSDDDEYKPGIGEVGFDPEKMLDDEYFKSADGVLQLRGPKNAAFYKWTLWLQTIVYVNGVKVYEKTEMTLPAICFQTDSSDTTEYYIVYIPMSGLKAGSYVISLTATSKGGEKYSDSAALIIYDTVRMSSN